MKGLILTCKHHDGFCLFDTATTGFKSTDTKLGRDIVKDFTYAARAEGLHVGLYYSLIDWHHPDFTIDIKHPRRKDANAKELNQGRDMTKYAAYMRNQITELLTGYGKIDILWFDFSYDSEGLPENPWLGGKHKEDWEAEKLIATARSIEIALPKFQSPTDINCSSMRLPISTY